MWNKKKNLCSKLAMAAVTVAASVPAARASVNVQDMSPAANSTYMLTEDAILEASPYDTRWHGRRLFFSATYNWLNDPFIEWNETHTQRLSTLVDSLNTLDLGVGVFLNRRLSVNFDAPLNLIHLPSQANQFGLGDSRAFLKYRLTAENAVVHVSLIPELYLPTGDSSLFLSDGAIEPGLLLAFERDFGLLRASANIGYRYSSGATFLDLNYTQRLPMALGLYIPLAPKWGANLEAAGAMVLPPNRYQNPGELYGGARYQVTPEAAVTAGISTGGVSSGAGNDFRFVAGLRFSPIPEAPAPAAVVAKAPAPVPVTAPVVHKMKRVVFTPKEIRLTEEVKFLHASAVLTKSGKQLLDEVADVMKKNRSGFRKILIEGHCNELGGYPYNQKLSESRAASVREYIASRGIDAKVLMTIGYGKTKPKALPGMAKKAQLEANRRVEFKVIN